MGLLNASNQTRIIIRFVINIALVLVVAICGLFIVLQEVDNDDSSVSKTERISKLINLKLNFDVTKDNYLAYVNSFKSSDLEKFNQSFTKLKKEKVFLDNFKKESSEFRPDIEVLQDNLKHTEQFYQNNIAIIANSPAAELSQDNLVGGNALSFNDATSIFSNLIQRESAYLQSQLTNVKDSNTTLAYLIMGVAAVFMVVSIVSFLRARNDLIKQVVHDKEIEQARHSAQSANNAKSEYLAMVSHEIRTPMNGVLGMSNLLLQSQLNAEQKDYVNTIHHSAESLLKVVNDVLDFSKIEAGKLSLDNIDINVRDLIQDVFAILPPVSTHLKVTYKVAKEVPEFINCDPVRLRQILINLLSNAIKFTPRGLVELECAVIENLEGAEFKLGFVVRDTGIGIPENKIRQLFKPFVQIEKSTTRNYGGTGLGLNITYNLVTMMGGKIKVKSTPEKGSVFTLFIVTRAVFRENVIVKAQSDVNPRILDNSLASSYPFKVLVVDDNEINLMLISKTLSKLGYECKKAIHGEMALDLVKEHHFDLIFMDMQMPVMDGPTATTEIRKFFRVYEYPVVIALTANTLGDNRDKCLEAGMQDFIAKPFKPAEIEEVIRKWAPKINQYREKNNVNIV